MKESSVLKLIFPGDSIDTLIVAPRNVERGDFFGTFHETLKENENVKEVRVTMYYNTGFGDKFLYSMSGLAESLMILFKLLYVLFFGKLCVWQNSQIARSGNYEEFGHELSSSGLLGSFGWTRVNLQMEAKGGVKQIVLTEEDIPGAKLPRGNAEECTVPQLRRWLLCRGAKTSGKKAELVKRFVFTMVFY